MRPPRLILIVCCLLSLPFLLTCFSKLSAAPSSHDLGSSKSADGNNGLSSWFSFQSPTTLFRPSAIISLTDDNSTFFLSRPAAFGPLLPTKGMSGQLWVGSGFGEDNNRRGGSISSVAEGELGCSDVPGWNEGNGRVDAHVGLDPATGSSDNLRDGLKGSDERSIVHNARSARTLSDTSDPRLRSGDSTSNTRKDDGTDNYLHHPLPESESLGLSRTPPHGSSAANKVSQHADIQSLQESAEIAGKVVLLSRGGCGFLEKVKWVQRRGGVALIVGDNTRGGGLVTMYAQGDTSNVSIPSLFTSYTTAHLLSSLIPADGGPEDGRLTNLKSSHTAAFAKSASRLGQKLKGSRRGKHAKDRPVFTSVQPLSMPTPIAQPLHEGDTPTRSSPSDPETPFRTKERVSWFRSALSKLGIANVPASRTHIEDDSRMPPKSGQVDWMLLKDWNDEEIIAGNGFEAAPTDLPGHSKALKVSSGSGSVISGGPSQSDDFVIGVQDWRDPDLVKSPVKETTNPAQSNQDSRQTISGAKAGDSSKSTQSDSPLGATGDIAGQSAKSLPEGSITPNSGEYEPLDINALEQSQGDNIEASSERPSKYSATHEGSWFGGLLGSSDHEKLDPSPKPEQAGDTMLGIEDSTRNNAGTEPEPTSQTEDDSEDGQHEGLWVTLTPTSMSTSPFFDTLLVLVVSPLVTLTVVYAMLLLRSRIRRRRWRAPKSVVERLPVRIYHTISSPSSPASSRRSTPRSSSPSSPLLQGSSAPTLQNRARSQTASSFLEISEAPRSRNRSSRNEVEKSQAAANEWRRRYTGKQVECVVCLEEYVDGVSKVMGLPCGHEFHVDCITPWLTTRRRTCPICKGDVVRSLARGTSSNVHYPPYRDESGEDIQNRAAESSNDSPSSAIPIPSGMAAEDGMDPESGYVSGQTELTGSGDRFRWRGLRLADFGSLRGLSASFRGRSSNHSAEEGRDR